MTISITSKSGSGRRKQASPLIVYANWFQFRPGERLSRPRVESRMFLAVHQGKGTLTINSEEHTARAGSWFFLPWGHALEYAADPADPFLVGGIHVIPAHDHRYPVRNRVAHDKNDPLAGAKYRRDAARPCGRHLLAGFFAPRHCRLRALTSYITESFDLEHPDEAKQRQEAQWLLAEIVLAVDNAPASGPEPVPSALERVQAHVRQNLDKPLGISVLARAGNCSVAGIHRLFRHWHGETPARWVAEQRAARAAYLLRTTRLPVKAIAAEVGIEDPFQFSRFFKRLTGSSPRDYRQRRGIL